MRVVQIFFTIIFIIKIIWNIGMPYMLYFEERKHGKPIATSVMIYLEMVTAVIIIILSYFRHGQDIFSHPPQITFWLLILILLSYFHFFVSGMILIILLKLRIIKERVNDQSK